jgi:hypothetical protein
VKAVSWFSQVIAGTIEALDRPVYVEIGVQSGATIRDVAAAGAAEVHGVDVVNYAELMPPGSIFWHMDSDRFFREYDGAAPDVIFIDGLHTYEQARRDYVNACKVLAEGGVIFLHDTCPGAEENTVPEICGDVYRLREELEALPVAGYTWRAFPGLTMVHPPDRGPEAPEGDVDATA